MPAASPPPASALEMAVMEANAVALGISIDALMENAGRAVAEEVARQLGPAPRPVVVLAGTGNNGGDGSCAAHYLAQWGYRPELWMVRSPSEIRSPAARRCFDRAAKEVPTHTGLPTADRLREAPLVVDALLGSGQQGAPRGAYKEAIELLNGSGAPSLAIDVPSGVGTEVAVHPRWTIALTVLKEGMTPANSGEIVLREIGIPSVAREETGPGEFLLFPEHPMPDPRGRSARLLVIGGGPYSGAPALAALAALRSGAERVTVLAPAVAAAAIRALSPDLIVQPVGSERFGPEEVPALRSAVEGARIDAIILGMGAGGAEGTVEAFRELLDLVPEKVPLVVDADGLRALSPRPTRVQRIVATPNAGEYQRVFAGDPSHGAEAVQARAVDWGLTLLVKGETDLISDGHRSYRNRAHHPAATVGGVGDVLAGVVGSLLAQGLSTIDAARLGAYWVGDAGNRAAEAGGFGILASDVLAQLPRALVEGSRRVRAPA